MKTGTLRRSVSSLLFLLICAVVGTGETVAAQEASPDGRSIQSSTSASQPEASQQTADPVLHSLPLLAAGSNSCEIVSCGMGIKQTCQITCPADKTPKCSCDCERSFGPMCMDYKANCRCE
jgi:hypothetical protein